MTNLAPLVELGDTGEPMANDRVLRLIATARQHPEFATRLLQQLPEATRQQVVAELAKPSSPLPGPGLRKCEGVKQNGAQTGLAAQLNQFAKSIARVG